MQCACSACLSARNPFEKGSGIAYDVQGSGPAVVLLTGSNLDRRMWTRDVAEGVKDAVTTFLSGR